MPFDENYFNCFIANSKLYFAHLPKETEKHRKRELLSEHSALTYSYAKTIIKKQFLDDIIENLIKSSIPNGMNAQTLELMIRDLFFKSIAFHDLGKVNEKYQDLRMKNKSKILSVSHSFGHQHSIIGVYIYLADFFATLLKTELTDKEQIFISNVAFYLSYSIYRHHSPYLDKSQDDIIWTNEELFALKDYLVLFQIKLNVDEIDLFHQNFLSNASFDFFFDRYNDGIIHKENTFPLFALCKLSYSLLTASDYLATAHYMNNWSEIHSDFGLIDNELRHKIIDNAENSKSYNKSVYEAIENNSVPCPDRLTSLSNYNLNELRKSIAVEVVCNIRKSADKKLFYIEAPTGGGKTNVSMLALAELLRADKEQKLNKVFYVFPFTTLITQTYKSLLETLGLNDDEIAEIHSKASLATGRYEDDYLNYINNLFVSYPISLLSHVRFFDILKSNDKETNYLLHESTPKSRGRRFVIY